MKPTAAHQLALFGGQPSCEMDWPAWPLYDQAEEAALLGVLHSRKWWFDEQVRHFEAEFARFQGAEHAVTCTNGTTAIEMALRAVGVVENDEVIVPPYSFIATASAVITVGAIPVFADILPDTLCLDPRDVQRRVTPRTRAVLPVHVSGRIADMAAINRIAAKHDLVVVEDAAHAWGSQLDGQGAGTLSHAGTFSFQESKNITAGEGGILVTNDGELAELCRSFTHCGRVPGAAWYDHDVLGSNLRMTEFQAALLRAQLGRSEEQLARRQENAARIELALQAMPGLRTLAPQPNMTRRSYHMLIFRVEEDVLGISRDRFLEALQAEGVPASAGWYRPLYKNRVFQSAHLGPVHGVKSPLAGKGVDYTQTSCPVCEQVCRDAVWIPQHVLLAAEDDIQRLLAGVQKVVSQAEKLQ